MEVGLVERVDIEDKMRSAYLSYAMSVITARALPDVRDGLKPVQRRILYAMYDMGLRHNQPTRKSARIVGEVLGKYHPHGESAVYEAMVRMAQDFTMRYVLVEGQGNFGSVDGDSAAAIRYTEARLSRLGEEMLADLDKNTVDFTDNFDGSLKEPTVLPAKLPNLLVNGVGGIAVGMATNIPPHNLGEVAEAIAYLVDHYHRADEVTLDDLMRFIRGPDFPTGGTILGTEGIRQAYATGKGRIVMRAQAHTEEIGGGRVAIIVSELPYQVNKAALVERIALLSREGRLEGIADLRDESDRVGMRIVIELKRGVEPGPVLSGLLKYTQMQAAFGVNMLALVDGEPRTLSLKRILLHYIEHRVQVVERRARYDLEHALARAHILEGLLLALDHLDEVISIIRRSRTAETAQRNLMARFKFTEVQAQAILDTQLRRLAALERHKLEEEYQELQARILHLRDLLAHREKVLAVVKEEALALKQAYGDARRTRIVEGEASASLTAHDLTPDEETWVFLGAGGTIRRATDAYQRLWAGPVGECESLRAAYAANAREMALFITDRGRAYALPVHQLPDAPQGLPLEHLVRLGEEQVVAALHCERFETGTFLTLATEQGRVKRVALQEVSSAGRDGVQVIGLGEGDRVVGAALTSGGEDLLLVSAEGRAIRFSEEEVRPQGLPATGMRGMALQEGDRLIALERVQAGNDLLIVTEWGFAKRTALEEYPIQGRGGQGTATIEVGKRETAGALVGAKVVPQEGRILLGTTASRGYLVDLKDVPRLPRASWGRLVTRTRRGALIAVEGEERVASIVVIGPPAEHGERKPSPQATVQEVRTERHPRAETSAAEEPTPAKRRGTRAKAESETPVKKQKKGESAPSKESAPVPAGSRTRRKTAEPPAEPAPVPPSKRTRRRSSKEG